MAAISTLSYQGPQNTPAEPFGQAGVRQYAGRLFFWFFLTLGVSALAMGHRSDQYADLLDWKGRGQMLQVASGNGQLALRAAASEKLRSEIGWTYRGGYGGTRWANRSPWASDFGSLVGFEVRTESPFRDIDRGFSLRLKWSTLALLMLVQPAVFVVRRWVKWRRKRAGGPMVA